jgi:hypothetical protein
METTPPMSLGRRWLFRLGSLCVGIVLAELTLQAAGLISPRVHYYLTPAWKRVLVRDPQLGFRMSPFYPGNDRWGFRNESVPKECEILTIGASTTFGFSAPPEKSWPRQLEALTGKKTYNMSCGGYGPVEFMVLLERGLALHPKTIMVEIYPGNDIAESYGSVYLENRFPEYKTTDEATLAQIAEADRKATLPQLAYQLSGQSSVGGRQSIDAIDATGSGGGVRGWLSRHSALYAVAREVSPVISGSSTRSELRDNEAPDDNFELAAATPHRVPFSSEPAFRTVFLNPRYCALAYDLTDPRIREGQRIMEMLILRMQEQARANNARLMIVIIPSKAVVYRDLARKHSADLPKDFFDSVASEEQTTATIEDFLKNHQVEFVNPVATLRAAMEERKCLYHETDDNHPNSEGYTVFAEAMSKLFK